MINIAVLGYGTVGSGIVEVIKTNYQDIAEKVGEELNISYVLDLREFPNAPINKVLVHDYDVIVNDPSVKIIAEAMGGIEPAYSFARKHCLRENISVHLIKNLLQNMVQN